MNKPNLKVVEVAVSKIKKYENNTKIHTEDQIKKIASSIDSFGWDVPIVLDKNHTIIKGHGRYEAAKLLGLKKVPCIVSNLPELEAKAARIADNKSNESLWDMSKLEIEMKDLSLEGFDLDLTGYDELDLQSIFSTEDEEEDEEVDHSSKLKQIDSSLTTKYKCPECLYEWS